MRRCIDRRVHSSQAATLLGTQEDGQAAVSSNAVTKEVLVHECLGPHTNLLPVAAMVTASARSGSVVGLAFACQPCQTLLELLR